MIEHAFNGPAFTVGVEEELMIVDAASLELAQEIEAILQGVPQRFDGQVKPELLQPVLEIATGVCADVGAAGVELAQLRNCVREVAAERNLLIAAAGTHPFAEPDDSKVVDRPRYRELIDELGYIARQELIFGTHVHVAIAGPDRAIYVADSIRRYLPLMLALSSNSPFWRGERTGMMSTRTAIFRSFPRMGIPPHYGTWEIYSHRVELMVRSGAIDDYSYLWWDVRPHPKLGTVETRIFDQQTRLEHTVALAALTVCLAHRSAALYDAGEPLVEQPTELIDDNKVRAAMRGMDGNLVDFRAGRHVPAREMARRLLDELYEHADELDCREQLAGVEDLLANETGAHRQLAMHDHCGDLRDVVREFAARTKP